MSKKYTLSNIVNKGFGRIERFIHKRHINWLATIYLNFRVLPFSQALRCPIYIYGWAHLSCLNGKVEIHSDRISRGMVKFGKHDDKFSFPAKNVISLEADSKIVFNGPCNISTGYLWRLDRNAVFEIGNLVSFGTCIKVICSNNIVVGNYSRIAFLSMLMDTNSHYTINLNDYSVRRLNTKPIVIGSRNWIGNNTHIFAGAKTGEGCVVGHNSMLNHDFSEARNSLLAGSPAVVKREGITRCFSFARENEIRAYFENNPDKNVMYFDENYNDPAEDTISFFI